MIRKRYNVVTEAGVAVPLASKVLITQKYAGSCLATRNFDKFFACAVFGETSATDDEEWEFASPSMSLLAPCKVGDDLIFFVTQFFSCFFNNVFLGFVMENDAECLTSLCKVVLSRDTQIDQFVDHIPANMSEGVKPATQVRLVERLLVGSKSASDSKLYRCISH